MNKHYLNKKLTSLESNICLNKKPIVFAYNEGIICMNQTNIFVSADSLPINKNKI